MGYTTLDACDALASIDAAQRMRRDCGAGAAMTLLLGGDDGGALDDGDGYGGVPQAPVERFEVIGSSAIGIGAMKEVWRGADRAAGGAPVALLRFRRGASADTELGAFNALAEARSRRPAWRYATASYRRNLWISKDRCST